jgi:hypothetical protein
MNMIFADQSFNLYSLPSAVIKSEFWHPDSVQIWKKFYIHLRDPNSRAQQGVYPGHTGSGGLSASISASKDMSLVPMRFKWTLYRGGCHSCARNRSL